MQEASGLGWACRHTDIPFVTHPFGHGGRMRCGGWACGAHAWLSYCPLSLAVMISLCRLTGMWPHAAWLGATFVLDSVVVTVIRTSKPAVTMSPPMCGLRSSGFRLPDLLCMASMYSMQ